MQRTVRGDLLVFRTAAATEASEQVGVSRQSPPRATIAQSLPLIQRNLSSSLPFLQASCGQAAQLTSRNTLCNRQRVHYVKVDASMLNLDQQKRETRKRT